MKKLFITIACAAALSACAIKFDDAPLNGRKVVEPGSATEDSLDSYMGDQFGKAWVCPDGRRIRWVEGGITKGTCAPDRP